MKYYSCIVPPPPDGLPGTEWHCTDKTGPWAGKSLSRGCFPTPAGAYLWARAHLEGYPYTIKEYNTYESADSETSP